MNLFVCHAILISSTYRQYYIYIYCMYDPFALPLINWFLNLFP